MLAIIKDKKEIAKGTLQVDFQIPEGEINFEPGQFINVELIDPPYTDAEGNKRYFSVIGAPGDVKNISIATRISQSAFKRFLLEAPIGTKVNLGQPKGEFLLSDSRTRKVVFIAGGIGITPFISILRYVRAGKSDYEIVLLYSNKDQESTAFLEELENYSKENPNFKLILTMTGDLNWQGEKRVIEVQFVKDYIVNLNEATYFVAGSPAMVQNITSVLSNLGVKGQNIKKDNLIGY
jgi:ferredoxin-NADP reductase